MNLHIPIEQLKWINEKRQDKSQQTFIIQLIDSIMKNEVLTTDRTTEEQHEQKTN